MKIPNSLICVGVAAGLYQGLIIAHELVHVAIYKYAGIEAILEFGLFWGQTVVTIPYSNPFKGELVLLNSLNEILLPIEILLIVLLAVFLYNSMEANDRKKEANR